MNKYLSAVEVRGCQSEPKYPVKLDGFENGFSYIMISGKVTKGTNVSSSAVNDVSL
jgi:hypothetical protein